MFSFKPLHPTFGAEAVLDTSCPSLAAVPDSAIAEITEAIAKYGFLVFRATGLDDDAHVAFSRRFGDLDNIRRFLTPDRKMRYRHVELFDAGNMDADGNVLDPDSPRAHQNLGNGLFHVDSSFNPRRASFCFLRAVEFAQATTDFADSRAAFDSLPDDLKKDLLQKNYIGAHCIAQSRKLADPVFYKDLDPAAQPHMRHYLVQRHEPSGRMNLYAGAHLHHLEREITSAASDSSEANTLSEASTPTSETSARAVKDSQKIIAQINAHIAAPDNTISIPWKSAGDIIMWDNRAVQHRAGKGSYTGTARRDMRRTTVHDDSPTAWGLNGLDTQMPGFLFDGKDKRGAVV